VSLVNDVGTHRPSALRHFIAIHFVTSELVRAEPCFVVKLARRLGKCLLVHEIGIKLTDVSKLCALNELWGSLWHFRTLYVGNLDCCSSNCNIFEPSHEECVFLGLEEELENHHYHVRLLCQLGLHRCALLPRQVASGYDALQELEVYLALLR